jgi:hypothetical protein
VESDVRPVKSDRKPTRFRLLQVSSWQLQPSPQFVPSEGLTAAGRFHLILFGQLVFDFTARDVTASKAAAGRTATASIARKLEPNVLRSLFFQLSSLLSRQHW